MASSEHRAGRNASASASGEGRVWRLYHVTRRADGVSYVGVTSRDVASRFSAHCADARRDNGARGRPGTLTHAIREAIRQDIEPATAFRVVELARHTDAEAARRAEANWIKVLGTARPHGFNCMPGGASLGSIANAQPIEFDHPTQGRLSLATISEAIAKRNAELIREGQPALLPALIYWRIASGWTAGEALGYVPHVDGRGLRRTTVRCGGRRVRSLRQAAAATGISPDALRSRVHRARRAGLRNIDIGRDRRGSGARRAATAPVRLPDPRDPEGAALNTIEFATATGVPKATVIHRLSQLRATGCDPATMSRTALLAALLQRRDRRFMLELSLPDGRVLRGGVRKLVRMVLDEPGLKWGRHEHLGASAIRARLRRLPGWRARAPLDPAHVQWAFGFRSDGAPVRGRSLRKGTP
jgi:hypothetical protein